MSKRTEQEFTANIGKVSALIVNTPGVACSVRENVCNNTNK